MTPISKLIDIYRKLFAEMKISSDAYPEDEYMHMEPRKILRQSASEIRSGLFLEKSIHDRSNRDHFIKQKCEIVRNIAFIQGCLWCCGLYSKKELDEQYDILSESFKGEDVKLELPRVIRWADYNDFKKFSSLLENLVPSIKFEELELEPDDFENSEDYQNFYVLYYQKEKPREREIMNLVEKALPKKEK